MTLFFVIIIYGDIMYIDVLVNIKSFGEKIFTYKINKNIENKIKLGCRVEVPLSNRIITGLIINIKNECEFETKEIISIIDDTPILNKELIELGKYMKKTYLCSLISSYESMLPSAIKFNKKNKNIKYETYIEKIKDIENPTRGEKNILNLFKDNKAIKISEIKNKAILKRLIENNVLKATKTEIYRLNKENIEIRDLNKLTVDQKKAYDKIKKSNKMINLLYGVTGSGKTEVYMHLIKDCINNNKTAIVLVPEISLTTQLIERFRSVFDKIAVLHSSLSEGERYDEWRKINENKVNLVIGTRSAIFAPLTNIGIIIIDEEHEDTYKQENNPRYSAVDIAIKRAEINNAKLLLGSATPSLESYARSKVSKYELITLLKRVNNNKLPKVEIIDMKEEMKNGNSILSNRAIELINNRINKKEQIMILINRRGYSNYIICNECGNVIKCPNCDISLTYHKSNNTLRCHYCGYTKQKPNTCPNCNSKYILLKGIGTEKIEELLKEKFNVKVIRMDKDSTSNKGMHEKIINDFNNCKYDILLGTQMISKGLDFNNVTLVIVLNGDSNLNIPDYKSSEKTFSLLTQVSGRAGRKEKEGIALIQTYNPNHYSIMYAKNHDYEGFFNKEIKIRKQLNYPPFCFLVAIRLLSENFDLCNKEIDKINKYLKKRLDEKYTILGPSVSLKINNIYKFQLIIKYKNKELLYEVLNEIINYKKNKIKLEIDFNPIRL